MKIMYKFINGEKMEIEVENSIGEVILTSRREESNLNRKERYHCLSSDAAFEGGDYADSNTPETLFETMAENSRLYKAFEQLSDIQKRRLTALADGKSILQISKVEGKDYKTVYESIEAARKKIKKFLKNTP